MATFYETVREGEHIKMQKRCSATGDLYIIKMPIDVFRNWKDGAKIQDAMPELSNEQREFIISGTTPGEWNKIFNKSAEEYEEDLMRKVELEKLNLPPRF